MDSTAQTAPRDSQIINKTASTGDEWIRQRKQILGTKKSSMILLPWVAQGFDSANSPWGLRNHQRNCHGWRMDSTAQRAHASSDIINETDSTGDTWIWQCKKPMRAQKSVQPTRVDILWLIFKNYLNICNLNFESHWWILLLNFLVLTCQSDSCILQFFNELNLTYQRLTSFMFHYTHSNSVRWKKEKKRDDCASKVSLSLLLYICIYCFYLGFFIIIDVLFSNEVSFNVSIGFWSLNELF
jgi:hypothetical protein